MKTFREMTINRNRFYTKTPGGTPMVRTDAWVMSMDWNDPKDQEELKRLRDRLVVENNVDRQKWLGRRLHVVRRAKNLLKRGELVYDNAHRKYIESGIFDVFSRTTSIVDSASDLLLSYKRIRLIGRRWRDDKERERIVSMVKAKIQGYNPKAQWIPIECSRWVDVYVHSYSVIDKVYGVSTYKNLIKSWGNLSQEFLFYLKDKDFKSALAALEAMERLIVAEMKKQAEPVGIPKCVPPEK